MPYIKEEKRFRLEDYREDPTDAGELNYKITMLITEYIKNCGRTYHTYNEVVGVLECAKLEIYRRMVAEYEDRKMKENGDVYPSP